MPSRGSKPQSEGEPVLFTLCRALPRRGAGGTAAPTTRVLLATLVFPPLGDLLLRERPDFCLKVWRPLVLRAFPESCNPGMLAIGHLGSFSNFFLFL